MVRNAAAATEKEHSMTLMQGVRLYPKAIGWAAIISTCCIMEGFTVAMVGNFYAFAPFNRKYGTLQSDGTYQVAASWQAAISNGSQVGQIVGLLLTGICVERFGYRLVILTALIYQCGMVAIFFCAQNVKILLVGYSLTGVSFGVFMSSTSMVEEHQYVSSTRS